MAKVKRVRRERVYKRQKYREKGRSFQRKKIKRERKLSGPPAPPITKEQ